MKTVEISQEERIEAARARLKTAYDQWAKAKGFEREAAEKKWKERKRELEIITSQQIKP